MSSPLSNKVEQALADFEQRKSAISAIQENLNTAYSTVTSKNRALAVTVDSKGAVTEVKFPTQAYRSMAGPELGELLVATIEDARAAALQKTIDAFADLLPSGLPMLDLITGKNDGDTPMPFDKLINEVIRDNVGQDLS